MRALVAAGVMVAVVGCVAAARGSESTKAIVNSYLQIHAALAADKTDGIKPAAEAIAAEASKMGASGETIVKTAQTMGAALDLKAAREALGPLTDAVIAAAKADGWKDVPDVKIGYCPMVRKAWIQKDTTVKNPYYGSQMLGCGELKDR